MRRQITQLFLICILVVISSCSVHQQGQEQTIKIGYIGPLTGELASMGESSLGGTELAVEEINQAGGVLGKQVELTIEDDQCSNKSVNAVNKLVSIDLVTAITGFECSAAGGPAVGIIQANQIPTVIRWASAPDLTTAGDYIFRIYPSDSLQGKFVAHYVFEKLNKIKAAVIYVKNDWGQGLRDNFITEFEKLGGKAVVDEAITQDSVDLRTQLKKVVDHQADVVYFPVYQNNAIAGFKQIKELGLRVPVIGGDAFEAEEIITAEGSDGVMFTTAVITNPTEFQEKVFETTGKKADKITGVLAYDSINIIIQAIRKAGSLDKQKIRTALAQTYYQGISSPLIEFDEIGDLKEAIFEVKIIKDKKAIKFEE